MYQQVKPMFDFQNVSQVKRIADNAFIPMDEANTDYQAYLAWVAEGNVPTPAEENT